MKSACVHIVIYTKHVNLGFYCGTELPDPKKLLQGDGKRIRNIRISSTIDLGRPHVRKFLCEAIMRAAR